MLRDCIDVASPEHRQIAKDNDNNCICDNKFDKI